MQMISDCTIIPGMNMTRAIDHDRQEAAISRKYIDHGLPRQLYLNLIATHPKWDGHGFAARHLQWGKELSQRLPESPWPITLLATPAGWPLYKSVGFEDVVNATVTMLDGLGTLWYEVMRWDGGNGTGS